MATDPQRSYVRRTGGLWSHCHVAHFLILSLFLLSPPVVAADGISRDVAYGRHEEQRYDVYFDKSTHNAPIIVMLHGGGWSFGRKEARRVWKDKAAHFVPRGYVFVSAETRLIRDGARPHAQAEDLARAVADIRARAADWGGDPSRIILMGHSAGAHIVSLVAADPDLRAITGPIKGVVALDSGALDLVDLMQDDPRRIFFRAFGTDPDYWAEMSPKEQIKRGAPPYLVVCRATGGVCDRARRFKDTADRLGVPVTLMPSPRSHMAINADLGRAPDYTAMVETWIEDALR